MDSDAILTAVNAVESITNPPHTPERSSYRARKTVEQIIHLIFLLCGIEHDHSGQQAGTGAEVKQVPDGRHQHDHAHQTVDHRGNPGQHGHRLSHDFFDGLGCLLGKIYRRQEANRDTQHD